MVLFIAPALLASCTKNNISKQTKVTHEQLSANGFVDQLSKEETPIQILNITGNTNNQFKTYCIDGEIGVIIKDGYNLTKRYHTSALNVSNANFKNEGFSTSYSAFAKFSSTKEGEINLIIKNNTTESLCVLVYKKSSSSIGSGPDNKH